jgi:hypothetical protein
VAVAVIDTEKDCPEVLPKVLVNACNVIALGIA